MLDVAPAGFEELNLPAGIELAAYADDDASLDALLATFADATVTLVEVGWEDRWRSFHRPVRAGGVWIRPPWEPVPDDAVAVVIDPGRAFGTGGHPTTRASLELIAAQPCGSLLDVGCGSGVLAIAAAKLGFSPVYAIDDDPIAIEATVQNAATNDVEIAASIADATTARLPTTDVVVMNILLPVVEALVERMQSSRLITSGYYAVDVLRLPEWEHTARVEVEGWAADTWRRASE
jgi:ribosomal protein L11 methyltransferase